MSDALWVEQWDAERDGPLTESALSDRLEARGYHVSRYVYPPGTFFPDHSHDEDKIEAVLSGRVRLTMGDEGVILERGDNLEVPHGVMHSAEVVGDDPVVSLDATRE